MKHPSDSDLQRHHVTLKSTRLVVHLIPTDETRMKLARSSLFTRSTTDFQQPVKGMLIDAGELVDDATLPSNTHPLTDHWVVLRKRLDKIDPQTNSPYWANRAEILVRELDSLDASSFTFRYPVNRKGDPNLTSSRSVDITNVREVMEELAMVLGGIGVWLYNYLGIKRDMESEFNYYGY